MTSADEEAKGTVGDLVQEILDLPSFALEAVLVRAIRRDPSILGGLLFPEEADAGRRVEGLVEFKRLVDRDRAKDAYALFRASNAKPIYPTELGRVAEELLTGTRKPPEPTVSGLLYPGRVNAFYGAHTAGKTWTALYLARLNAQAGGRTLMLDYEDTADGVAARCSALDAKLAESVSYVAADGVLVASGLRPIIEIRDITLVILDSVGESMSAAGLDSNSEQDVTQWFTEVADGIAALGPAVLLLDHIAKRQDGTPSPVGSFRKSAAITGAQFALENKVGFSRERQGWSQLTCTKDRHGYFATGEIVARVDFVPNEVGMNVELRRGEAEVRAGTGRLEQAILAFVDDRMESVHGKVDDNGEQMDGRPSITQIREAVKKGGVPAHNTKIREAVDRLVEQGWLALEHIKSGKTTRDVYVPGHGGLTPVHDDEEVA